MEPPGLRERKKQATRRALALAALRLTVERGFDGVLVEDIAAEVGVSPRTFNNYFSSKAEAICALAVDRAQRAGAALRARPRSEPLRAAIEATMLAEFATGAVPEHVPDRVWIAGLRMVLATPAMQGEYLRVRAAMQRSLSTAIADRLDLPPASLLPDVIGGAVAAACDAASHRWIEADPPVPLLPLVEEALRHLADY
ncbi:TetR/AcrR family transcriptional regulator [Dactylosporangium matsuzakiense]|uniref:TetR family transcriptional regulator n=1 Tax=Dactylosporangium matsuzakiense TaxID=53360 RepID=A0A9W6KR48_9ACTN|nr:TetR/AcrR family transcriptional regulator [Dactylosporangium matsuzakiense]UWZ42007.1 TetR family transcriptional regulator [Dactylosporangium matsuzakiense]GLL04910.1 TetR family transcriptional regulator [Dactylosporangium matsuzakiense]